MVKYIHRRGPSRLFAQARSLATRLGIPEDEQLFSLREAHELLVGAIVRSEGPTIETTSLDDLRTPLPEGHPASPGRKYGVTGANIKVALHAMAQKRKGYVNPLAYEGRSMDDALRDRERKSGVERQRLSGDSYRVKHKDEDNE